jgi:heat shock transcription factor
MLLQQTTGLPSVGSLMGDPAIAPLMQPAAAPEARPSVARRGQDDVPVFIAKTFEIFSNQAFGEYCAWNEMGTTIIIKKVGDFSNVVLPHYFKHSNFNSFVRQLNM